MKYMLLIYEHPAAYEGEQGRKLLSEIVARHRRLGDELRSAGVAYPGNQLQPAAVAPRCGQRGAPKAFMMVPMPKPTSSSAGST